MKELSIHELVAVVGGEQVTPWNDPNWLISIRDGSICKRFATDDKKQLCYQAADKQLYADGNVTPPSVLKAWDALGLNAKGKTP